ncbi:tRNA (adenosine(37)-N6)-threonylcarbamoyltransferase complex dimerization subunit type 1 TsaB [Teredinibacter sp. KSP-S5-2]|uniref:tRNA (adenosine(37)-N6)-threonylcarbamoyltransferase complex dimerization subunit type 1 TsaB n=1 Tax=Teredinibacter sp. KSP-S5-2 TaxID=3034506 RepID=UPI0029350C56|nr:tRNA (adenosine(37)-N6)-threonylcarbamoyltransferase complex dimerization subunit type 1 TsaB [Teredinibacter sp. KSP-S5-2]WNO08002.1 tRNA (adenosine(37)-N6)-threonylcarbamoyltransferase complex dimerization subunit type 1 TsaB [Teredinibacter sp. KSP-S5-2]
MNNLLAIESSTEVCSVALLADGNTHSEFSDSPRSHADWLLPAIDSLMNKAGCQKSVLDAIVLSIGPGSFTGIRIGIGVAQGLAYALSVPLVTVSSLEVLVQPYVEQVNSGDILLPALDARMGEVYWSAMEKGNDGLVGEISAACVSHPQELMDYVKDNERSTTMMGVGHGWKLDDLNPLTITKNTTAYPLAQSAIELVLQKQLYKTRTIAPEKVEPLYLRNEITWEKRKRIRQS